MSFYLTVCRHNALVKACSKEAEVEFPPLNVKSFYGEWTEPDGMGMNLWQFKVQIKGTKITGSVVSDRNEKSFTNFEGEVLNWYKPYIDSAFGIACGKVVWRTIKVRPTKYVYENPTYHHDIDGRAWNICRVEFIDLICARAEMRPHATGYDALRTA